MTIATYRKKPVEIKAIRWDGTNNEEVLNFLGSAFVPPSHTTVQATGRSERPGDHLIGIKTLDSIAWADPGDWILLGTFGEFYPCKDAIFQETYALVADS